MATISTANSYIDGTGVLTSILTAGAYGTAIKAIIIKAQNDTSQGMVRFYVNNGVGNPKLIKEVGIPIVLSSSRDRTYSRIIPLRYTLAPNDILYASTQNGEVFNIIAIGLDWSYGGTVRSDRTQFYANTGIGTISTANTNRNGTGTMTQILEAGVANVLTKGCLIKSITIKALQNVTPGMVRLFLEDLSSNKYLFYEVVIPPANYSGTFKSFIFNVPSFSWLRIQDGYKIYASTENSETFAVTANGVDWDYPV